MHPRDLSVMGILQQLSRCMPSGNRRDGLGAVGIQCSRCYQPYPDVQRFCPSRAVFYDINCISNGLEWYGGVSKNIQRTMHSHPVNLSQTIRQPTPVFLFIVNEELASVGYVKNDKPVVTIVFAMVGSDFDLETFRGVKGQEWQICSDEKSQPGRRE